ncbi:MAG: hypothetical protein H0W64_07780 [Gammaproteobacteria bacterium]|nr:hypothetical protein [Gammaproteobacteria bacterium]
MSKTIRDAEEATREVFLKVTEVTEASKEIFEKIYANLQNQVEAQIRKNKAIIISAVESAFKDPTGKIVATSASQNLFKKAAEHLAPLVQDQLVKNGKLDQNMLTKQTREEFKRSGILQNRPK